MDDPPTDEFLARGEGSFTDFAAARRRVARDLDANYGRRVPRPYRWAMAAALLLLCAGLYFGYALAEPPAYADLVEAARLPLSTAEIGVARSAGPAPSNSQADVLEAIHAYHDGHYALAARHWNQLAAAATGSRADLFTLLEGSAHWLDRRPERAVSVLLPLATELREDSPVYHRLHYVLGLATLERGGPDAARPYLERAAAIPDALGDRARRIIGTFQP